VYVFSTRETFMGAHHYTNPKAIQEFTPALLAGGILGNSRQSGMQRQPD
jgi:hypothetical protein